MKDVLLLDLGTSCCKVAVIGAKGNVLSKKTQEYDIIYPHEGYAEQNAEVVWKLVKTLIKKTVAELEKPENIGGMGFSLQGEAVIPINKKGEALYNAILGMDTRCRKENDYLLELFGERYLYYKTGMPIHTVNTLPKILWLKNNEEDIFNRAWKFVLYEDFLIMKLSGKAVLDSSLASRTQMYDINLSQWSEEILDRVQISIDKLGEVVNSGQIMGEMSKKYLLEFGLKGPIYLVAGGHDQACAALGCGLVNDFDTMDSIGTAEVIEVASTKLKLTDKLRQAKISTYRHVIPDMYLTMTLNHTAGLLVRWCIENFFQSEIEEAQNKGIDKYDYIIDKLVADWPTYKLVIPHFNGSGTPWVNDIDTGVIFGLSLSDNKDTILKSILEGLVYELRLNIELLEESGYNIKVLNTVGGGAKSDLWLLIRSSILNRDMISSDKSDSAIYGAFLLAGTAINLFGDVKEGLEILNQGTERKMVKPDNDLANQYESVFRIYKKLYPQVTQLSEELNFIKCN